MAFRLRRLAGAGALVLPAAALAVVLPGAAAQAASHCSSLQAEVFYAGVRQPLCQSSGGRQYPAEPLVIRVCAGEATLVSVESVRGDQLLDPGDCVEGPFGADLLITDL